MYELSQKFMLLNRFVSLFTKVIWGHPDAPKCKDVLKLRTKAIEYLNQMPAIRDRMRETWEKSQWTSDHPKPPIGPDATYIRTGTSTPIYPKLDDAPALSRAASSSSLSSMNRETTKPFTYPTLADTPLPPPAKRMHSVTSSAIILPFDLPATFSDIAKSNTFQGIETCGILLGVQKTTESYKVTTMIIPKQTGTRDTCETLNGAEETILSYDLSNDLVCLGWIHTHPTQSCFLSSVDMHTTLPYQQMLSGAVAIVVAPTDTQLPIGVWRLTEHGMMQIKACKRHGFHDHEGKDSFSELVTDIQWDTGFNVVVVDNRK